MTNTYTNMQDVAESALAMLVNQLGFVASADTQYQKDFETGHWDKGDTITIRKHNRFNVSDGAVISSIDAINEPSVDLTLDYRKKVVQEFTTQDLTLYTRHKFDERFIKPAVVDLANAIELSVAQELFNGTYFHLGTAGVAPTTFANLSRTRAYCNKLGIPAYNRYMGWDEDSYADFISNSNLQNNFVKDTNVQINKNAYLGALLQFEHFTSVSAQTHIAGTGDGTAVADGYQAAGTVNGEVTDGVTIVVQGVEADTENVFRAGDKIYFGGVETLNPRSHDSVGRAYQAVVTADADSTGTDVTITLSTPVISDVTDPFRNITAPIPDDAPIFIASAGTDPYKLSYAFCKDGIVFAAPPLRIPSSVSTSGRKTDDQTGISIRLIEEYDVINDRIITRFDVLYGILINGDRIVGQLG